MLKCLEKYFEYIHTTGNNRELIYNFGGIGNRLTMYKHVSEFSAPTRYQFRALFLEFINKIDLDSPFKLTRTIMGIYSSTVNRKVMDWCDRQLPLNKNRKN